MKIIGIDTLVFAANDLDASRQYMLDYGLNAVDEAQLQFETLDGTGIHIHSPEQENLPPALGPVSQLRKIIYGVADEATLQEIAAELGKDREVKILNDQSLESLDDAGITIGFQMTKRRTLSLLGERVNAPGAPHQRGLNELGVDETCEAKPRTLAHVALFVPDAAKAEAFYVERLGFRCSDRLGGGPFLRAGGTTEHHTMFLIQAPAHIKGLEHASFHLGGVSEVMLAGNRFQKLGYDSFWGPGRHGLGSNWFWYFDSPLGCRFEYDADIDHLDETWVPREWPLHEDNAQAYLLEFQTKNWAPFNGPKQKDVATQS